MRTSNTIAACLLCLISGTILGFLLTNSVYKKYRLNELRMVISTIDGNFVDDININSIYTKAAKAIAKNSDIYGEYFTKEEWKRYEEDLEGKYVGIGLILQKNKDDNFINIVSVIENSPAYIEGILSSDKIIKLLNRNVQELTVDEAVSLIKNHPHEEIDITIKRDEKLIEKKITKGTVTIIPVYTGIIDKKVGYVRITSFANLKNNADKKINELLDKGAESLVIDLRYNLGGILTESTWLTDLFLDNKEILTVEPKQKDQNKVYMAKKDDTRLEKIPIAILINSNSASASEIFAGAIKDNNRGKIIGTRSYGKGLVQSTYRLPTGDRLKVTTSRYKTPSGRHIQKIGGNEDYGIIPDILVEIPKDDEEKLALFLRNITRGNHNEIEVPDFDLQLKKAVEVFIETK
ncbi:MAG: S41 family peptidase [Planctomycetes bacterium]|nr:S41 family peptidase [Planctomycetota bacterium]